jgi:hypothetical protein
MCCFDMLVFPYCFQPAILLKQLEISSKNLVRGQGLIGAPEGIRTPDPQIRRLRVHVLTRIREAPILAILALKLAVPSVRIVPL